MNFPLSHEQVLLSSTYLLLPPVIVTLLSDEITHFHTYNFKNTAMLLIVTTILAAFTLYCIRMYCISEHR